MAGSRLTAVQRQVLRVGLMLPPDSRPPDRTVDKIAARTGLSIGDVETTLRELASLDPPLVQQLEDATLQIVFWIAVQAAIEALDGPAGS
jgi:hypothetical protein